MDSIRLKRKELQSKMYLTQTQTHRLRFRDRLTDSLDSLNRQPRRTQVTNFTAEKTTKRHCKIKLSTIQRLKQFGLVDINITNVHFHSYRVNH